MTADPCLFVHIQARLNIRKLAVRKYRHKEIDGIRLTFFGIVNAHRFRRVAVFLARFTAFLVARWRFPSGDSMLSGARNIHTVSIL